MSRLSDGVRESRHAAGFPGMAMPDNAEVYLAWSYERLAALRADFVKVLNSEFIWQHEDTHVEGIIARIDAIVDLKRQRDGFPASKRAG